MPAQILQGDWVDASQAAIEQHRKTDVTVIVLDQNDRAVQGAKVQLTQQRHDFVLGLMLPDDRMPPDKCATLPVYRCFNAVALDRYTDWSVKQTQTPETQAKRLAAWQDALRPIRTHYGRITSADPARNHDSLALLEPADLRDAVLQRIDRATAHDAKPDDYDLYADLLQQDIVERKLGQGMLYRMFEHAQAGQPKANFGLRARDAISHPRGRDLLRMVQKLQVRQVPLDHITIEQPFRDPIQSNALKRSIDNSIAPLPLPVTLASVQVGGPTPIAAAINLETVIRLAFAEPRITGIYFAGLVEQDMLEDNASLLQADDQPAAPGEVLDQLFTKLWCSDERGQTDERGNAQARVFTGWYTLTATLPDGTHLTSRVYIPKAERAKMIVLQATAAEAK